MRKTFSLLALGFALAACSNTVGKRAELTNVPLSDYRLDTGDKVKVTVFGQDNLSNSYTVDSTGHITVPLVGPVNARNVTGNMLAKNIESRLREGYIREPKVTATVETYRPFYIMGEVAQAGQFQYVNGMTVQTAVAIAGGYSARASQDSAEITRRDANGELITGSVKADQVVMPGDTVRVPERWF